ENTIFIFMTDNGTAEGIPWGNLDDSKWQGFNAGMRGKKGTQYDGGHRVPFFIRWPAGNIGGGRDVLPLAAHIDVLPTLLELCGLKPKLPNPIDGRSLVPLLRGGEADWPQRTLFVHVQREEIPPKWSRSAIMTDRWRLVDGEALFDMLADPGQQDDVGKAFPEVVGRLRAEYERWWSSLTPAFGRFGRIVIGADAANPTELTCHDWHSEEPVPWDQGHIRRDMWVNGYWMVDIAEAGEYEFTLRRQPRQAGFPLQATSARIQLGDANASTDVAEDARQATLTLKVPAGPARMQTWLRNEAAGKTRGAFFVEAKRLR
ncbi:MAG TPA: N-acetylgalactosamine 6-sulfate sulfatase, partial [Verrucomicrobiales bacterium]|nr:N-acetylgalactosamine 6-sulfate sulfatase [Verrucomicrobiales bacterium]